MRGKLIWYPKDGTGDVVGCEGKCQGEWLTVPNKRERSSEVRPGM